VVGWWHSLANRGGGRERKAERAVWREGGGGEKGKSSAQCAPFIITQGDGRRRCGGRNRGWKTAAVPRSRHRACDLGASTRTVRLTSRPHEVLIFPDFPKPGQTCKFKIDAFHCSKNSQILHETIVEYYSQLYKLCRLQTPNISQVKNPGIDSIFEFSMNFKMDQTFWEKSNKFSKILS
jgi:hypothetical protein